jgi:ribokinase
MRRTDWDVVVVGGANMDFLVKGSSLPDPGQTIEGESFQQAPGGKGANQAVAAARLGVRVAMVARVGKDEHGSAIVRGLEGEHVSTRHVSRDEKDSTGVALIMVDQRGEKQILTAPGANRRMTPEQVRAAGTVIQSTRVVLAQLEVPLECVLEAARLGRKAGARFVLDPAPALPLPDEFLGLVDVIRPNASEARVLTGITVTDRDSARRAAEWLLKHGAGAAIVQAGDEGDLLVDRDHEYWLPRFRVKSIDATGAGDAFAAALAVALAEGRSLAEAGPFASAAAALATTVVGAQAGLPRRDAVLALLAAGMEPRPTS